MTPQVSIDTRGRAGTVTYREAGNELVCHWEFGGDVVAIVQCGDGDRWRAYPWALPRRTAILRFVADEVVRQQAPTCRAEIDLVSGDILLHQQGSGGQAAAPWSRPLPAIGQTVTPAPSSEAAWVFRLSTLRMKFGLFLLLGSLVAGALMWIKQTVFSIDPGKGTPIGASVRTDRHIATLIQNLEPYVPSLHRSGGDNRYRIGLFLVPLDGGAPRLLPIKSGLTGSSASQVRLFGSDGRVLWFDAAGLGGVDLESLDFLPEQAAARMDARSLPRPWGDMPMPPRPEKFLAAGYLASPTTWLGLHTDAEAGQTFAPGKWLKPVVSAESLKQPRRFYRGALEAGTVDLPGSPQPYLRIQTLAPLGQQTYLNAAFLRMNGTSPPIRLQDPPGALMVFTSAPGLSGTTVLARVGDDGQPVWQVDTGIDRFELAQILPGSDSVAFVGTRPPVPDKVSEPLLVIVEYATGKAVTHSLWQ
jgi:hypothetical protein